MSADTTTAILQKAVAAMNATPLALYQVTIICTTDDHQASYWMDRLRSGICAGDDKLVLAVAEDWNGAGGAGNGLGTLYAWEKACRLATDTTGRDLAQELAAGTIAAALYHTAGKGTRMAPLPAAENNNKPGVKLPFPLTLPDGSIRPLSVLEAVIRQTGTYAPSRLGRLSVFWGDQVFVPSVENWVYTPTHHADILCALAGGDTAPTAQEWEARGLDKYGVIACLKVEDTTSNNGDSDILDAAQVEKVDHPTAVRMLQELGSIRQVGPSLGSFSVSALLLDALCAEYKPELTAKTAKLDTDPHFWMPLTLGEDSYVRLMGQKGTDAAESTAHYQRMVAFKTAVLAKDQAAPAGQQLNGRIFGAVNVGKDACWWDYGQLKLYSENTLLLLEDTGPAKLLREFLGVTAPQISSTVGAAAAVDAASHLFDVAVQKGTVTKSLLTHVRALEVAAEGAIIVNCAAKKISAAPGSILYNIIDDSEEGIVAGPGVVKVAVTNEAGVASVLESHMDKDGGKNWKIKLDANEMTFEEVHKSNKNTNIGEISAKREEAFAAAAKAMGL